MNSKVNLVIDGNYFLHKCLSVASRRQSLSMLGETLLDKYKKLKSLYPFDKVFLVNDRKNYWRRRILTEYKQKEKKEDNLDWEYVFNIFLQFREFVVNESPKTYSFEEEGYEGDDWIAAIIELTNIKKESNIIVSRDSDMYQLLDSNIEERWINIMYNFVESSEAYYIPSNFYIFLTELKKLKKGSIFDISNPVNLLVSFLDKLNCNKKLIQKDKEEELFIKVISGDMSSDNIPSVYINRKRGIGKITAKKIYHTYKTLRDNPLKWDDVDINNISDFIMHFKPKNMINKDELNERIKENLSLIKLDTQFFPDDVSQNLINKLNVAIADNKSTNRESKID